MKSKGTVLLQRACGIIQGVCPDGQPSQIKYYNDYLSALQKICRINLVQVPTCLMHSLNFKNICNRLEEARPSTAVVVKSHRGKFTFIDISISNPLLPFPLRFLILKNKVYLIDEITPMNRCDFCGRIYKFEHSCSLRRRDFYFQHIHSQCSDWWEQISFFPIGSCPTTERLFITYDVETYTWHGQFGKQLVPFMLVFHLHGESKLVKLAQEIAIQQQWDVCENVDNTFYMLNPQKRAIGVKFKTFRQQIQQRLTYLIWQETLSTNPNLRELSNRLNLQSPDDLTHDHIASSKLCGKSRFIEIYVIGHNINGFDEIVLAAQVLNYKTEIPAAFKITRNFMPRNGKILFNDITFSLPNPEYIKPNKFTFKRWEQGCCEPSDFKYQFIKFMVRDTFQLTHTSLAKAAEAYALPAQKGHCPYQAVNEFYMTGSYQTDDDNFPSVQYWKNEEEYAFNKNLWKKTQQGSYDIIQTTLAYCIQDVRVTSLLVTKLQESYTNFISEAVNLPTANFNIFQRPTISSNSHAIFRQIVYRAEKPQRPTMGNILFAPSKELYNYVRASIRGGRCYPTFLGELHEPIYVYDICGMYASALTHPLPAGAPLNPYERTLAVKSWEKALASKSAIKYFNNDLLPAIFTIDADPPSEEFLDPLPPFCSRKGGRLCWTNEPLRGEVATCIDVITLHNRGWVVRILPDEKTTVFSEWKCVAKEYVELNIRAKEKADSDKNQTLRSIAKLLSNALYGSFATKLDNKRTIFSDQMDIEMKNGVASGLYSVKSSSFIETDDFSARIMPEFTVTYLPAINAQETPPANNDDSANKNPIYSPPTHVTYTYKPITFLEAEEDDACLHTLELNSPWITNNRYPSQIASFVLAWTRAFISEWADFLYEEDRGTPWEDRPLKSVYGDTDSLFLTELGRHLMETKGKKRLKKNGGSLVFKPDEPDLTWLVECETQCAKCGGDAFSPRSVFLAPKLYALQNTVCIMCGFVGKGKLRAKGHATDDLTYELLTKCYYADIQESSERFQTSRLTLRKAITTAHVQPFTVTESTLIRTLRPWQDKTLRHLDPHHLIPYSMSHPNPRDTTQCWMSLPWDM